MNEYHSIIMPLKSPASKRGIVLNVKRENKKFTDPFRFFFLRQIVRQQNTELSVNTECRGCPQIIKLYLSSLPRLL